MLRLAYKIHHLGLSLSYFPLVVGIAGFEPATSWSQTKHTTGLYYSPLCDSAAARTQDSYIKSVVLYQLSYEIILLWWTDSNRRTRKRGDLQSPVIAARLHHNM